MGKKLFFEKCTIGLGVLDAYLTPAEKQEILKVERCVRGIRVLRHAQGKGICVIPLAWSKTSALMAAIE